MTLTTSPLTPDTWPAFATLVEAHNGVFGGCWCIGFHEEGNKVGGYDARREVKLARVRAGTSHAALVFDGDDCVGWCQFGSPSELPRIKNRKAYYENAGTPPAWRITCFFVDRRRRGQGIARTALQGAISEMARLGGGVVEAYPEDTHGKRAMPVALHGGVLSLYESLGFVRDRQIGKNKWVVRREIAAA